MKTAAPSLHRLAAACAALLVVAPVGGALAAPSVQELEEKVRMLEAQLSALKGEISGLQSHQPAHEAEMKRLETRVEAVETAAAKPVRALEDRVAKVEQVAGDKPRISGDMLFFRGGYTALMEDRAFNSFTDTHQILGADEANDEDSGWYVGAGFDFLLTRDTWGMLPGAWVQAELGLEFKHFGSTNTITVVPLAECLLGGGAVGPCAASATGDVDITMLTVSAAPKIEFMEGSKLRPWIIPVGLDINVISPPSDSATVLDLGAQFGLGAEYEIVKGIKFGLDARYHYAADFTASNDDLSAAQIAVLNGSGLTIDQDQDNDFWTVGGYLGIGF